MVPCFSMIEEPMCFLLLSRTSTNSTGYLSPPTSNKYQIINHQPYDQKADVFSFAIVLWELLTAKVPYDTMTPLQAALGVRQGLRPELPENAHPRLLDLMQRCWVAIPSDRPGFSDIKLELEQLLHEIEDTS